MVLGGRPYVTGPYAEHEKLGNLISPAGSAAAERMSAFNFCSSFDDILPPSDGTVSALDRQHLWGMFIGIAVLAAAAAAPRVIGRSTLDLSSTGLKRGIGR